MPIPAPTPVLVVDDDADTRQVLHALLEDTGYAVFLAPDGEPALQRLREHPRGMVVLLDLNMPGVDGAAVLRAVAAEPALAARHAFVLLTANAHTFSLAFAQLLSHLAVPVVPKPFDIDQLLAVVDQAARRLDSA